MASSIAKATKRTRTSPTVAAAVPSKPAPALSVPVEADDAEDKQKSGVQSLGRAFAILEEVAKNRDGISLAELSKAVGLHNSTTFHLVRTMVSLGYIRQLKDTKRYRIGRPIFALAANCLDEMEMVSLATPVLEDLSRDTGESSHFAVRMADNVVIIARTSGPGAFQLADRVGVIRPMHCTAIGKVMLSSLRSEQFERYLARADLSALTAKTITEPEALRREIDEVRASGLAFDDSEFDPEVRCCAVAVRDYTGQVVGAVGISGPIWRLTIQALQGRVKLIRDAARKLSSEFGAPESAEG